MFGSFRRKDVTKTPNLIDGNDGNAQELLHPSLYSELRTSEGAKHQQQRICGPTVALSFNFLVAVGIILLNKLVLGRLGFNFPIFLTFIHCVVSWFLMSILKALSLFPASPSKSTPLSSSLSLGIIMCISTGLANVSLKYNSVGFYQMAKIVVTPVIILAEFLFFGKSVPYKKGLALTVVSIVVAVATVTDLQFHFFGACVALAWIIPSAINKIQWSNLQQQEDWTALALMWKTTPIALVGLVIMMPWLDPPGALSFNWNLSNTLAIIMTAILGFLLQWSSALALGATSAITHVVLGQLKTSVILLGGFLLFGSNPGRTSICGAVVALLGMSLYTYLNLHTSHPRPKKTSPRESSFASTKLTKIEDDKIYNESDRSANIV